MDNQSPVGVCENILKKHPEINIQKLAESSGFLSQSNFIKLFSEKEGCTPAKWKNQIGNNLCSKTTSEKVTETHFQKVLKRQKVLIRQFKKC